MIGKVLWCLGDVVMDTPSSGNGGVKLDGREEVLLGMGGRELPMGFQIRSKLLA
jgi:hypothetical protein